jgi:succinoglycan biosynthesis transport protein ExoP
VLQRISGREQSSSAWETALDIWGRRKWTAIAVCAAVLVGTTSLTVSLPNVYRATATVLVEQQQISEAFVRSSVTAELETRIQTIQQEIMSRTRLSDLIDRFGLYPELRPGAPLDALVERVRRYIQLDLKGDPLANGLPRRECAGGGLR